MLKKLKSRLEKGIELEGLRLYTRSVEPGRISNEEKLTIFIKNPGFDVHLMYLKIFYGRGKYYRPWVEFTGIVPRIELDGGFDYFDSAIEDILIRTISGLMPGGGKIYIPYEGDFETVYGLNIGIPPILTRLGFKLYQHGFTWFKDWYFPEGGSEGGQKLQGEKPLNDKEMQRQLKNLRIEIDDFTGTYENRLQPENGYKNEKYIEHAFKRGINF